MATIQRLITAGLSFPSGVTHDPSNIRWESVLLDGTDLGTIITREAESRGADLIFMRSRRRPYAAALMGSTAEAVARLGPCPVLVMHADELEWLDSTTGEISLRNVLVAYDFSPHSQLALHCRNAGAAVSGSLASPSFALTSDADMPRRTPRYSV
ncbi:MAG TPA: universal stress protein [Pyrinomonadaceae bacterium]|nr:universal stress protein [Pyrinomonadaceae bacterium]HEU4875812.1 universal stress protein [Pyrinomonadaceae bacterium]